MVFRMKRRSLLAPAILSLCITAALPNLLLAQGATSSTTTDQTPDQLGRLKQALSSAGATALTTAQETALTTLIESFRTANTPAISATRLAYDNYILAGEPTQAIALIPTLAAEQAAQDLSRTPAGVTFAANAVAILLTSQLNLLQQALGTDGLVQLIQSLAGGPAGPGNGQGGPPMN